MTGNVAVVSTSQLQCKENYNYTVREMVFKVARDALDKAGLTRDELGAVITSSSDYWLGVACSNEYYMDAAGGYLKETSKVEEDSSLGFVYALMRIMSGEFDTALVVAVTKGSEIPSLEELTNLYCDPFFQRPAGLDDISAAALHAQLYMNKYGLDEYPAAEVAAKNLNNAYKNPNAFHSNKVTTEEILKSDMLAYPIKNMERGELCDGACALLLASEETAGKLTDRPVWVRGAGWSVANYFLGDRDDYTQPLREAANAAYRQAGIKDPFNDLDMLEICDAYSFQEIAFSEALGVCEPGKGYELLKKGITVPGGSLPVNPSGGVLGANPYVARGLYRIIEAANQIKGEAGPHQLDEIKTALAHNCYGMAGQSHAVVILGS